MSIQLQNATSKACYVVLPETRVQMKFRGTGYLRCNVYNIVH
jgi:hypothetical protein